MRSGENPLDLNNLPDDNPRQVNEDTSSSAEGGGGGYRRNDQSAGKVYECRFCSLKFCKSQALGGHMNRHRQERETETLNKARQLVFGAADSHLPPPPSYGGGGGGGLSYHHHHHQMRSISSSSSSSPALYPTAAPRLFSSSYPSNYHHPTANELCYMGHVVSPHHANPSSSSYAGDGSTNYTCIGAPVGQSFPAPARTGPGQMD